MLHVTIIRTLVLTILYSISTFACTYNNILLRNTSSESQ